MFFFFKFLLLIAIIGAAPYFRAKHSFLLSRNLRKLVEFLKRDSFWLRKCGFQNPPSHNSFSDFVDRVGADAAEQLYYYLVGRIMQLKGVGKLIAVDSTSLKVRML